MAIHLTEDFRSVTDLKRHARDVLAHLHRTGRPVVLTVNGKADAVIVDAKSYEKHLEASHLSTLLVCSEQDVVGKRTRPMRDFLKRFRNDHKI